MEKHVRSAARYYEAYERPLPSESILNRKAAFKPHPFFVPASVLELGPSCLSEKTPIAVDVKAPANPLSADALAEAFLTSVDRGER